MIFELIGAALVLGIASKLVNKANKPTPKHAQKVPTTKEHAQTVLSIARANKIDAETDALTLKNDKTQAETQLIFAKIDALKKSGADNMPAWLENMGINSKDYKGCAACNFIDATGKERFCPKCRKPLHNLSTE